MKKMSAWKMALTISAIALFLPVAFSPAQQDGQTDLALVNQACGQATECAAMENYICSTYHNDYEDYACTKGCSRESLQ